MSRIFMFESGCRATRRAVNRRFRGGLEVWRKAPARSSLFGSRRGLRAQLVRASCGSPVRDVVCHPVLGWTPGLFRSTGRLGGGGVKEAIGGSEPQQAGGQAPP